MTDKQKNCFENEKVLDLWQGKIDITVSHNSRLVYVCGLQAQVCEAIPEYMTDISGECSTMVTSCQKALRHLHSMMFNQVKRKGTPNHFVYSWIISPAVGPITTTPSVLMLECCRRWQKTSKSLSKSTTISIRSHTRAYSWDAHAVLVPSPCTR